MASRLAKVPSPLVRLAHYEKTYIKSYFGKHGRASGLNPGILWPRHEELEHMRQYEKAFHPPLEKLINDNVEKKRLKLEARLSREKEVMLKLKNLETAKEALFQRMNDKKREQAAWLEKREKLIEEVREILGFRANPSDDRFKEALANKEEEEAKAKKKEARKKRESATLEELLKKGSNK